MAAAGASLGSAGFPLVLRRDVTSCAGSLDTIRAIRPIPQRALSVQHSKSLEMKHEREAEKVPAPSENSEDPEIERCGLKDYFEQVKRLIKSDRGPPRWFSPLECASRVDGSPLLLFLPGIDGVGLGLALHHQELGKIFDIWCLHIPAMDRTPLTELLQLVEQTIRSESYHSPTRPIYIVGESLGACLALAVAARNPDIDLVLILANPGTSFNKSQLQLLLSLLEVIPGELDLSLPYMLNLMKGEPLKMVMAGMEKRLPMQKIVGELFLGLITVPSYISVLADILPRETLLWKLQMLKSASAFSYSRLHAVKAQILILSSGKDQFLPSQKEGERLRHALQKCEIRKFDDSGHFLFLEDGIDLTMIIKGAGFYRRARKHDYVSDYFSPTPSEFEKVFEPYRWIDVAAGPVMLSTLEDGKIVRGLAGIPSEGPVLLVGYHMLLGLEIYPLVSRFFVEKNIILRGIAHPLMFERLRNGRLPDLSTYDGFRIMGAVPVSATNMYKLLSSKAYALLYPGGMREALHRKGEEYKLFWPEQSEFTRMAARFGAKIIPFGVVGEDDFGEVFFDYDDLMNIPYFKAEIAGLTDETAKLRTGMSGEVANQDIHLPGILPKLPGRFYYLFGKPIDTEGKKELRDREKAHELYLLVKSEVESNIAFLKEKRKNDPYRYLLPRLVYHGTQGFASEAPTFEL